jgi:hypothetical protein
MTDRPAAPTPNPAREWDVFISHAGGDTDVARKLKRELDPPARVFLDREGIRAGDDWREVLDVALKSARVYVFFISREFGDAHYVKAELTTAVNLIRGDPNRCIIPLYLNVRDVTLDDAPLDLRDIQGLPVPDPNDLRSVREILIDRLREVLPGVASRVRVVADHRDGAEELAGGNLSGGLRKFLSPLTPVPEVLFALLLLMIPLTFACLLFLPPEVTVLGVTACLIIMVVVLMLLIVVFLALCKVSPRIKSGRI